MAHRLMFLAFFIALIASAQTPQEPTVIRECLAIERVGTAGRSPVRTDPIEAQIVAGTWTPPKAGDTVTLPDGSTKTWETLAADAEGNFEGRPLRVGYAYVPVPSDRERVALLHASGHSMVTVNGEPRIGDIYGTGYVLLPILLYHGENRLLFQCGRGRLSVQLVKPKATALFNTGDSTLPDLTGEPCLGATVVINADTKPLEGMTIRASLPGMPSVDSPLDPILPLSVRKAWFLLPPYPVTEAKEIPLELALVRGDEKPMDIATLTLRTRMPEQTRKVTFMSAIDGSVQYYAINPAQPIREGERADALILTLHGAQVEAIGQAAAYSAKSWGHLVAPTNRRPFGFDWEDWGRLDAMEVLNLARKSLGTDPAQTYLTGHSMGGHGVWHIGVTFPDRFAAIAPSAGWISFASYGGGRRDETLSPMGEMFRRASAPSDTLSLSDNTRQQGVYILHGGADDNVPVAQARTMNERLAAFHRDFVYHEQPGAGHWWDASDEPGTDCVDWAPIFDLFQRRRIPRRDAVRQVDFATANPGVSASCHWATVEAQVHPLQLSSVRLRFDPYAWRVVGETKNVARLTLSLPPIAPDKPLKIELDGQTVEISPAKDTNGDAACRLSFSDGKWTALAEVSPLLKNPRRSGPFKEAFRNRMVFVYGTKGTPEENAWAFAKARFDSETWWVRGNGVVEMVADTSFDPSKEPNRNVILYGNADTNAAWNALLSSSPTRIRRGTVSVGKKEFAGEDLACLFLQPRPGSDTACVAAVGGSGLAGMRLTDRFPYLAPGIAYPDCTVIGSDMLNRGMDGIRAAGFYGQDWQVDSGEFVEK